MRNVRHTECNMTSCHVITTASTTHLATLRHHVGSVHPHRYETTSHPFQAQHRYRAQVIPRACMAISHARLLPHDVIHQLLLLLAVASAAAAILYCCYCCLLLHAPAPPASDGAAAATAASAAASAASCQGEPPQPKLQRWIPASGSSLSL